MSLKPDIYGIIKTLHERGIMDNTDDELHRMNGTTDGLVYTLTVNGEPKYVLKLDRPQPIILVEQFHHTYRHSRLLPKLVYTDPAKAFIVYSYIPGTTHVDRGAKINWMTLLVKELLNHYERYEQTDRWGRLETPRPSWREFNDRSVEGARNNVGNLLPAEDYDTVKSLVENISKVEEDTGKFLLHGDTGVHNFVFDDCALTGVIDPSPMAGPVLYDFTYAFCSSPDDLNLETLFAAYALLHHEHIDKTRLIEEVIVQLYCRIGICAKVHPRDLEDYLKAWDFWRKFLVS